MKLMALRLMLFAFAYAPLRAIAQEVQVPITPPAYYGSGPWHMWTYGGAWHFWLMIPMMIFFFLLLSAVMLSFVRGAFGHWGVAVLWRPWTYARSVLGRRKPLKRCRS